jgi:hypothetical protein
MRQVVISAVFVALAACGTPQQQCIGSVTRDLRVVDQLIAETQGNLTRGYAIVRVTRTVPEFVDCTPEPTKKVPHPRRNSCFVDVEETVSRPAAIDLDAEAAKLASLQRKRIQLATAAAPAIQACQLQYPEAAQ